MFELAVTTSRIVFPVVALARLNAMRNGSERIVLRGLVKSILAVTTIIKTAKSEPDPADTSHETPPHPSTPNIPPFVNRESLERVVGDLEQGAGGVDDSLPPTGREPVN